MNKPFQSKKKEQKNRAVCAPEPTRVKSLLQDCVGHIAKQTGEEEQEILVQLWLNWDAVMSTIEPPSCPLGHKGDCLFVGVSDNMEMMEIRYQEREIVKLANNFLHGTGALAKENFFKTIHPTLLLDKEDLSEHKEFSVAELSLDSFKKLTGEHLKDMVENSAIAVCYRAFMRKREAYEKGEDLSLLEQNAEPWPEEATKPVVKQEEESLQASVTESPEAIQRAIAEELSWAALMEEEREEGEDVTELKKRLFPEQTDEKEEKQKTPSSSRLSGEFLSDMKQNTLIKQCYEAFLTCPVPQDLSSDAEEIPRPPTTHLSEEELYRLQEKERVKLEGTYLSTMKSDSVIRQCYEAFLARSRGEEEDGK